MKGNFERAGRPLLLHEGKYSNHPNDPGGPTQYGVTQRVLGEWIGRPASIADVKALTIDTALKIYKKRYWDIISADELPGGLDYVVFDGGVNSGPGQSVKWLQRALRRRGLYSGPIDGIVGVGTLNGAKDAEKKGLTDDVINDMSDQRLAFMRTLRNWESFKNGWTRRVKEVRGIGLKWDQEDQWVITELPAEATGKALPTETKTIETPQGDAATKEITLGAGGLIAFILSQLKGAQDVIASFGGLSPETAKYVIGGVVVIVLVAMVGYGIRNLANIVRRRREGESLEAE